MAIAEQEAEKEAAAKYQHVSRAQDLIMHLDRVRSGSVGGLWEFDKSPMVSKRRLQFKKIVNGKINTLAHDGGKILEVSRLVCDAISNAAKDDSHDTGGGVTTMGKKYLLDLLCSNLIVRVQADGFNGTRGDGFPLAAMFAQVSVHCEEIGPVLEGHLYTVCRMAIPALSLDKTGGDAENENNKNNNDDFLMESLGMIRDKNGEFESFEKFLHRTEVSKVDFHLSNALLLYFGFVVTKSLLSMLSFQIYCSTNIIGSNLNNGRHHVLPSSQPHPTRWTCRCTRLAATFHGPTPPTSRIAFAVTHGSGFGGLPHWGRAHACKQVFK